MLKFALCLAVLFQTLFANKTNNIEDNNFADEYYHTNDYEITSMNYKSNDSHSGNCLYEGNGSKNSKSYIFKKMTYEIINYPTNLNKENVKTAFRNTFNLWSNSTGVIFKNTIEKFASIIISFNDTNKNGKSFGDKDYVMYSTKKYITSKKRYIYFNKKIEWSLNKDNKVYLPLVAAHAIGHCLGLKHSEEPSSIMYPYFDKEHKDIKFSQSDNNEIKVRIFNK